MRYKALLLGSFLGLLALAGVSDASVQVVSISGVGVSNIAQTSADIGWTTSTSTDGQAFYGTSTAYGLTSALQTATTTAHTVTLGSLMASTTYHFMVQSKDSSGNTATSTDQTFTTLAPPVPDVTAPVISGIAVSGITQNAASISWTTNEPADTQTDYGTTTAYGLSSALQTATTTAHSVALGSLTASTTYHFIAKSRDAAGNLATSTDQTFTTLAAPILIPPTGTTTTDITAFLKVEPRTLNARSRGRWIEAEMQFFANGYAASDVNTSSIKLNGALSPDRVKVKSKRHGNIIKVEMKFSRQDIIDLLTGSSTASTSTPVVLAPAFDTKIIAITGIIGAKTFGGTTTVRVLSWQAQQAPSIVPSVERGRGHREEREDHERFNGNPAGAPPVSLGMQSSASSTTTVQNPSQGLPEQMQQWKGFGRIFKDKEEKEHGRNREGRHGKDD